MLILTRRAGESLYIGDDVKITIVEIKGNQIRLGIDAPSQLRIYREEIYLQILEENKVAAQSADSGLEGLAEAWNRNRTESAGAFTKLNSFSLKETAPQVSIKRKKKVEK